MHGNVFEWCQDWHGDYPQKDVIDPQGAEKGEFRVLRGGSWTSAPLYCRSAFRFKLDPVLRLYDCGLRVCFFVE
jgi:formylglycine-generating enzyme required for sulfatase activity